MKQDYFLFLYNKLKNKYLAFIGTAIIYLFICIKYMIKKQINKKDPVLPNTLDARQIVSECWLPQNYDISIYNQPINPSIDLSIIVPVYNHEKEVKRCIESLLNQKTTFNYEIIIVDDGSNGTTKKLLSTYEGEPRIKLVTQDNSGISGARNTGIECSSGKYLMFVDCDDFVHENCVQILMETAINHLYDIVMGAHALVKKKNDIEASRRNIVYSDLNVMNYKDEDFIMNYAGLPWGKVYKRELFDQIRFPKGYWYEDTIIQFLVFRIAKSFCYVPLVVYDYIWYEDNFSKTQQKSKNQCLERFWIVEKMIKENDRIGLPHDKILYKVILNHLGRYLYKGIQNLPEKIQKAVFVLSREIVIQNRPRDSYHLNYYMKQIEFAFLSNDFTLWKLASESL